MLTEEFEDNSWRQLGPVSMAHLKAMPVRVQRLCMVVLCGTSFEERMFQNLFEYLKKHEHEFCHLYNKPVDHPIIDQTMFLSESQKKQLKKEYDIEPWTFEQHLGEAVFIAAGCPYQVRNRQSCIKVALGFISPESIEECIRLTQEYMRLPKDHKFSKDKLEIQKIVLHAASSAIKEAQSLMQNS
ncbi:lysine-specific demethylase JMJ25 [Brassica rapa]|uniref:lysine-specific demethylase JMJ25 n=1 Tax=Brassica campestris TaxID=3711 RepID=UPI00142E2CDE|nr:lysine-specific demethylase JMJ25 [Brassica rapa]